MKTNLRDYQRGVVAKVIAALDRRKRTLLVAPTGSGKTVMFAEVVAHYAAEGLPVLVLAHRRELLTQAADKLAAAGVEASVYRGKGAPFEPRTVVVASVQTGAPPGFRARLVVVDEAHHAPAKSYRRAVAKHKGAVVLGVTATPWWQSTRHLDGEFKETVRAPGVRELTELGYLARVRMFTHPHTLRDLDLRGVATAGGDYAPRAVCDRVDRPALLGDIVEHWKAHAPGERTLAFAASVAHSLHIVARFVAAGVAAEHLDGDTPDAERKAILRRLETGETLVVSSYNVLTEGLDAPAVGCVILARPTKRLGVYRQCVGRGMRRAEGKDSVVVLDHAGSCLAFGLPDEEVDIADPKRTGGGKPPVRRCPSCGLCVHPSLMSCPECTAALRHEVPTEEPTGTLVEVACAAGAITVTYDGKTMTVQEWATFLGIKEGTLRARLGRGMPLELALRSLHRAARVTPGVAPRSIAATARKLGINPATLVKRLEKGMPLKKALSSGKLNERKVRYLGKTTTPTALAREHGINLITLCSRLRNGWSVKKAVETPVDRAKASSKKGHAAARAGAMP